MAPPWLLKIKGGLGDFANRLTGPADPYLSAQENAVRQQQARMAMAAQLLRSSGPRPKGTGNAFSDLGTAIAAGQQAGNQFSTDAIRARLVQAQLRQAQQGAQEPATIREMIRLGYPLTPEGFKEYNAAQARPGTTINIGEKLQEPIPIAQIGNVRTPDGKPVAIGTTYQQARDMGAQVQTSAEQQRNSQAKAALGILDELEQLALGPGGVFSDVEPGILSRAGAAVTHAADLVTQNSPASSRYDELSRAGLAPFIKFLGESGALAEGDVTRALGLLPRTFPLPDTEDVARQKLKALREIINRGVSDLNAMGDDVPPLPDGYTLDD